MREAGALGGKAAGSGAGGCMFFLGPDDPAAAIAAARALGMTILPVRWSRRGSAAVLTRRGARRPARAARRVGRPRRARAPARRARRRRCSRGRRSSRGTRRCSRPTAASVPTTATALEFDPWSPDRAPLSPLRPDASPASGTTAPGPASSTSGSPSAPRRWPRWPRSRATTARPSRAGEILSGLRLVLLRLSQPRQRPRPEPALLLHLSRVHLAHQLPRGRDAAAGERPARRTTSPRAWRSSPTRPRT